MKFLSISKSFTSTLPAFLLPILLLLTPLTVAPAYASGTINIWWPTDGAHVSGVQPFKAVLQGQDVSTYSMSWQVDNGQQNDMPTSNTDSPHKEASVDLSSWNWNTNGIYHVTFTAKDMSGNVMATQNVTIYLPGSSASNTSTAPAANTTTTTSAGTTTPSSATSTPVVVLVNASTGSSTPLYSTTSASPTTSVTRSPAASTATTTSTTPATPTTPTLPVTGSTQYYVLPNSDAAQQEITWASNPSQSTAMKYLAAQPTATWFGDWNSNIQGDVGRLVNAAKAASKTPILVAYNIPDRDCGGYSAGGTSNYLSWISAFARGINGNPAVVILEPDALSEISCLSSSDQATRLSLLSQAVSILKQGSQTKVYIDAGHANWIDAATMAQELQKAGIAQADGFSLNISNFDYTSNELAYGTAVSKLVNNKHFVIDTSRNGNGMDANNSWCNPSGRAVGPAPTTNTGSSLADAYLWIKVPGESDGTCNGGPAAGSWWASYALQLVQNAHLF